MSVVPASSNALVPLAERPARRGLQVLLPADFSPIAVRSISEYAGCYGPDALVGRSIRLSLDHITGDNRVLHDCYVVHEGPFGVIVQVATGASLQIPREDIGGMRWEVDQDANPNTIAAINADWVSAATRTRCNCEIGSIDMHLGAQNARSVHRRIRGLGLNETIKRPNRPPFFVYTKSYLPYLALQGVPNDPEGYQREACAYSALSLCKPAVAPICHHAGFHPETGSYSCVLEDLHALPEFTMGTDNTTSDGAMKRLFASLAVLHGAFVPDEDGRPSKELAKSMVHPKVFYAAWAAVLHDEALQPLLDDMYGVPNTEIEESTTTPANSVTLIHGNIRPDHIRLTKDKRASPNLYLLDWKSSGVGPCEVDMLQAYLLVPQSVRKAEPGLLIALLQEYQLCLSIFYQRTRKISDMLLCMRDVSLLLARSGSFEWNQDGAIGLDAWLQLHDELCARTSPAQLAILRDQLGE